MLVTAFDVALYSAGDMVTVIVLTTNGKLLHALGTDNMSSLFVSAILFGMARTVIFGVFTDYCLDSALNYRSGGTVRGSAAVATHAKPMTASATRWR